LVYCGCKRCDRLCWFWCALASVLLLSFLFLLVFVAGVVLSQFADEIIDNEIDLDIIVSSENSENFKGWENNYKSHPALYQKFYMYNLTNLDEIMDGALPSVVEKGPYVYWVKETLIDIEFSSDHNQVVYNTWENYEFMGYNESNTNNTSCEDCKETDVFLNMNPAYSAVLSQTGGELELLLAITCPALKKEVFGFLGSEFTRDIISEKRVSVILKAQNSIIRGTNITDDKFYSIWANSTTLPSDDWVGMVVSYQQSKGSGISLESARELFNQKKNYSLVHFDKYSIRNWAAALVNDSSAKATIISMFNISEEQLDMVLAWINSQLDSELTNQFVLRSFDISSIDDIQYLQWGSGSATFFSVKDLYSAKNFSVDPEFFYFFQRTSKIPVAVCKQMFLGNSSLFEMLNFAQFAGFVESKDFVKIEQIWGLNKTHALEFLGYLAGTTTAFGKPFLENIFAEGGGLFTQRTVHQWLMAGLDPLLVVAVGPKDAEISLITNETSPEFARSRHRNNTVLTGNDDVKNVGQYVIWNGMKTLEGVYDKRVTIAGVNDIGQFQPHLDLDTNLTTWDTHYLRPLGLVPKYHVTIMGIKMLRYEISNDTWERSYDFNNPILGFANVTGYHNGSTIFMSNPHMFGADPNYVNKIKGMKEASQEDISVIDIEPNTGSVTNLADGLQINLYLDPRLQINTYHKNVQKDVIYPIAIIKENSILTEKDAQKIKDKLFGGEDMLYEAWVSLIAIGGFFFLLCFSISLIQLLILYYWPAYIIHGEHNYEEIQ